MVSRKESNLSGSYKGPDDVDFLLGCPFIQNVAEGIVEGYEVLTRASKMPGSKVKPI